MNKGTKILVSLLLVLCFLVLAGCGGYEQTEEWGTRFVKYTFQKTYLAFISVRYVTKEGIEEDISFQYNAPVNFERFKGESIYFTIPSSIKKVNIYSITYELDNNGNLVEKEKKIATLRF